MPRLTAREAGYYKAVDSIFVEDGDLANMLAIVETESTGLHAEYAKSGVATTYTSWLETEVLRLRAISS